MFENVAQTGYFTSTLEIKSNGQTILDGQKIRRVISPLKDSDILRIVLLDKPDLQIPYYRLVVILPPSVSAQNLKITPRLVHTYNTAVAKSIISNQKIAFSASDIDQRGTFSLEMDFPKGTLELPTSTLLYGDINSQTIYWWVGFASIVPMICLVVLALMLLRHRLLKKHITSDKIISHPPTISTPAVVEVLTTGRITARSIAATLVDLARRGYLNIGLKNDDFVFGKHNQFSLPSQNVLNKLEARFGNLDPVLYAISSIHDNTDLKIYERLLLSKLFTSEDMFTNMDKFKDRIGHRLFSEKIARIFSEVYALASIEGYFVEDPKTLHSRWKMSGLIMLFSSFIGFGVGALYFPEPKTMLLFWVGMMLTAVGIIKFSAHMPVLSSKGMKVFNRWMSFKNFLSSPKLMPFTENSLHLFDLYLPYAIVLGVENEWSARFRDHPFTRPSWFNSNTTYLSIEQFDSQLLPLVEWIGQTLTTAKTPIVD